MGKAILAAILAFTLLTGAVLAYGASSVVLVLLVFPFIGVVCGSDKGAGQIVSSRKAVTGQVSSEAYTRAVESRDAELLELPIDTLEGIEPEHARKLRDRGIDTLQDLLESQADDIAAICEVPQDRAQRWMAAAKFAWMETVSEEDAEAIVYGGGIVELEELAATDPSALYKAIVQAIELGHVSVPKKYKLTQKDVEKWVREAKDLI